MADLTITPANVRPAAQSSALVMVQIGATVTAGQPIIKLSTATKYVLADANAGTFTTEYAGENGLLIAMDGGVDGDWISAAKPGSEIVIGATLTVGQVYGLSTTAGGIAPVSDLVGYASGVHTRLIGQAKTTAIMKLFTDVYFGITR